MGLPFGKGVYCLSKDSHPFYFEFKFDDHSDPTKCLSGVDPGDIWGRQTTDKQLVPSFHINPVARRFQRHPFYNHIVF